MNRRVVDAVGDWLFAPTAESRANLLREHLPGRITVTGNTVIDALAMTCAKLAPGGALAATLAQRYQWLDPTRRRCWSPAIVARASATASRTSVPRWPGGQAR